MATRWTAGRRQIAQKRPLASIPDRQGAVLFVIADAGIDDDPPSGVSTRNEWMVIRILPASSANRGDSQPISRSACGVA